MRCFGYTYTVWQCMWIVDVRDFTYKNQNLGQYYAYRIHQSRAFTFDGFVWGGIAQCCMALNLLLQFGKIAVDIIIWEKFKLGEAFVTQIKV